MVRQAKTTKWNVVPALLLEYANQTGDYGQTGVRETPENQHGISGDVEPAHAQPNYKGHDAG